MDEPQRERVLDDLKGVFKGELLFDELSRALYSTDASIFQIEPLGVVAPRDEEDVRAVVRYAAEHRIPLIARGAGTGMAGEALGTGIIIDLSRHFRSILDVGDDTVRVQPGVVYRELNERLAKVGRRFAPDPTSGVQCTVGGMVANNASGAHVLRHGYTRDHVAQLRVVLDNGDAANVGVERRAATAAETNVRLTDIVQHVSDLLESNYALLQSSRPRTPFDRCGYLLHDVLTAKGLDLARLLVGSEGTLAVFTEATLRTIPLPGGRSLVLLAFESLDAAVGAAQDALSSRPAACELIDRRLMTLAGGRDALIKTLLPPEAEAVLLVEHEGETEIETREATLELADRLQRVEHRALYARIAFTPEDIERIWTLRETVLPGLYGIRGGPQPIAFVEDVGVPSDQLVVYLHRVQEILKRREITASFLVHAGSGQVHTRPFLDLERSADVSLLWAIAEEIHGLALELGGTVSTQHGTGLARTPWVERQYGRLYPVFRELKTIFDPQGILNPGKIVGPDPGMPAWPLRRNPVSGTEPATWSLRWQPGEVRAEAVNCNGCGQCRTEAPGQRMCPVFRVTHEEAATPRAKANLLRHLLQQGADARLLSSDEVRGIADLCVNCRMCASECPAHINIPKLMLEVKAANVSEHGLDWMDWTMTRTESFAAFASIFAVAVNAGLASKSIRWLMEKVFGVSRRRRLPRFAARSFLRRAARRGWTRRPQSHRPRVAYFVDVFANYNEPLIAEAVVAVLQHNGIEVYVPPKQKGCGMAPLAYGDVESARETAEHNLRILAELVRDGYQIVCSEPTAALMLSHDYPDLIDDPDAKLVAQQVRELTAFLWDLHEQGRLQTDFQRVNLTIGHHVPCHLKALGRPPAGPALLALIPGLSVHTIDVNCSGMAGTFGLQASNYEVSLEAGKPMLEQLNRPGTLFGSTECSTCRLQMEDVARKRTMHPAQYMALAYGLMPELLQRLHTPIRELVL
ncbi:MAG TPA: anaerobic glycerol-3-phosphate dehydrogenase subunit C [Gemmataceae bacterium]|nr:anaerobic glycerol-3-phosphate dehydrogenase subunit C [Gemmataceae bacterium]